MQVKFHQYRSLYWSPFSLKCIGSGLMKMYGGRVVEKSSQSYHLQQRAESSAALKYSFMVETPTEFCLKSFQQLNLIQFYSELLVTA